MPSIPKKVRQLSRKTAAVGLILKKIVTLLETKQCLQATIDTREAHEGKTQQGCCYHDNGNALLSKEECSKSSP